MQPDDIEPLEPAHWLQRIGQLSRRRFEAESELERALRLAYHLVQLAPRPLRHIISCLCGEAEFEALLKARDFDAAVLRLIGERTRYLLNHSDDGSAVTAQVWYPDQSDRYTVADRTAALALLRAWLDCNAATGCAQAADHPARVTRLMPDGTATQH